MKSIKIKIVEYLKDYEDSPSPPTLTLLTQLIVTGVMVNYSEEKLLKFSTDGSTTVTATVNACKIQIRVLMKISSPSSVFDTRVTATAHQVIGNN